MLKYVPQFITAALYGTTAVKKNLIILSKFQKRATRLILDKDINAPSHELVQQLGWFRFDERVEYPKAVLVYKSLNSLAPGYLSRIYLQRKQP